MLISKTAQAIEVTTLRKSFGDNHVIRDMDLVVPHDCVFTLLGPNGAGKTTLINILTTLITPDTGTVKVAGFDVSKEANLVRASIGVTGQFAAIDGLLTGKENLDLMARLAHLNTRQRRARTSEMLELFNLTDVADRRASTYSGGMRRRLDLAMSLMLRPKIVFLDEPTTGVDPRGRAVMWDAVRDLAANGTTIFLTTQYLEEADQLADHIAVMDRGIIVTQGTPAELKSRVGKGHLVIEVPDYKTLTNAAQALPHAIVDKDRCELRLAGFTEVGELQNLLIDLNQANIPITNFRTETPDLDDVFFAITDGFLK